MRRVVVGIVCFFVSLPALADLRNAAPVQNGAHYAVPGIAVYTLGFFGVGVMWFAFTCPTYARPVLLTAGTISILGQYVAILMDLAQYGDAFSWHDAFLLPAYCVVLPAAYSHWEHVVGLVLPSLLIVISTLAVPLAWTAFARSLGRESAD